MSLPASLAIVDVETTGANPVSDRITEIAILRVEHGRVVERWSSLVNPGRTIPANIQSLIGITDEMQIPVRYIGIGEKVEDLRPFDAKGFADALFAED